MNITLNDQQVQDIINACESMSLRIDTQLDDLLDEEFVKQADRSERLSALAIQLTDMLTQSTDRAQLAYTQSVVERRARERRAQTK